jgi:SAM-dependent methyltransferase
MLHTVSIYRCCICKSGSLDPTIDASGLKCTAARCGAVFPFRQHILDTLVQPDLEVVREMKGMALENGFTEDEWEKYKIHRSDSVTTIEQRMATSTDVGQYDRQTMMNFEQALALLGRLDGQRVLEVGAVFNYHFLRRFREQGAQCVAANIHVLMDMEDSARDWPEKVLADMNNLPFKDAVFDVVLLSATSHHSPNLERTVAEVERVLSPGGRALFLSDPVGGIFKRLGGPLHAHDRHDLVHENEYPIWQYHSAFRKYGFKPRYLFSAYYDEKLRTGVIHPNARFATFGKYLSRAWQVPFIRNVATTKMLWPAHAVFGFPLNVVLEKRTPRA